jgi:hypothetical protein
MTVNHAIGREETLPLTAYGNEDGADLGNGS